jgi:6-pyruvoyl-tetrahydropterin synthase related domain
MIRPAHLVVAGATLFGLVLLFPEWHMAAPEMNDSILHMTLARYDAVHWAEHWPVDFWFPSITAGFPMFEYYPHLSHLVAAAIARWIGSPASAGRVYATLDYLLLAFMPLSIFLSLRRMGLSERPASFAAMLYPLLASEGYYGIGWDSYVWSGHGLLPQLWGTFFIFPAFAWGYHAAQTGKGWYSGGVLLALCTLSHFLYGYIAALSLTLLLLLPRLPSAPWHHRLTRLARVALVTGSITAYFVIPFLLNKGELLHSRWEPGWKWDSMGWQWLWPRLLRGEIFDSINLPVLSILVALGVVVSAIRVARYHDEEHAWLLGCFLLWIVLFLGRPTLGRWVDLLPLSSGIHMHRFIGGVQVFGIVLAGVGLDALFGKLRRFPWPNQMASVAPVTFVGLILLIPALNLVGFMQRNDASAEMAKTDVAAATDFHELVSTLSQLPPGRVHAGFAGTWGGDFKVGGIPVYSLLQSAGFDMIGYLFMAMARPGEWQVRLDYRRLEHLDLFNIRYLFAPADKPVPAFAALRARRGSFALYEVPTSGYFAFGSIGPLSRQTPSAESSLAPAWEEVYQAGDLWLQGPQPARHQFLSLGAPPPRLPSAEPPHGLVLDESVQPGGYSAHIAAPQDVDLILKVTYHPYWHCEIDARPAAVVPVIPGFMAVRLNSGSHSVRFTYRPPLWKKVLFLMALSLTVGGTLSPPLASLIRRWGNRA